jgi:hypothetical protein
MEDIVTPVTWIVPESQATSTTADECKRPVCEPAQEGVPEQVLPTESGQADSPLTAEEEAELTRIKDLPKEVGVMLMTVGVLGFVLPGVVGTPAIIAGGLVLWPKAFGKVESWFERRFPKIHRQSLYQINRYLNDLESRYPNSISNP